MKNIVFNLSVILLIFNKEFKENKYIPLKNISVSKADTSAPKFSFIEKINDSVFNADFENNILMRLKINGSIVHPDDFKKYQKFVDKAQQNYDASKPSETYYSQEMNIDKMPENLDVWEKTFKETLEADKLISLENSYKIEFGDLALRINGKNVDKKIHEKYLKQFKDITGVPISGGFKLRDR